MKFVSLFLLSAFAFWCGLCISCFVFGLLAVDVLSVTLANLGDLANFSNVTNWFDWFGLYVGALPQAPFFLELVGRGSWLAVAFLSLWAQRDLGDPQA